jgi:oligopeptidase B
VKLTSSLALAVLTSMSFATGATPASANAQQNGQPHPPTAARRPHATRIHGRTLTDDYFWLRQKGDSDVVHYLEAENAYTSAVMKPTEPLQQSLYDEMLRRIKQTDLTAPYREGQFLYYSRTEEGKQYPVYVRTAVGSTKEIVLLDENEMAKGHTFYAFGGIRVSDDGNLLAFTVDTTGYRQYTLHVKDLRTGEVLPDHVDRTTSLAWAAESRTVFVTTEDSITKRSDKFWRHTVGTATSTLLYDEKDELFDLYSYRSRDRAMVFLGSAAKTSSEVRYVRADQPTAPLAIVVPRAKGHEYDVEFDAGKFFIRTNRGAKNFRIVTAPVATPARGWKEVVAHDPRVKIEGQDFFRDYIVVAERENGLPYLRIIDKQTGQSHRISTPEPVFALSLGTNRQYDASAIQFDYTSLVTPRSTFSYDMGTRARTLLKQQEVAGYDPAQYASKRLWATAHDGVKVPVAVVYRKGTKLDGSAPMLLYAYGSYGYSIDPTFSSNRLSLLDRGFVYAQPSIRGGGELGEPWREAGRMMKKMNTFTDFIDVADYLIKGRYTSADRLMIEGGSAGGLLMGAVTNMRPDLFKAVVAQVPFVDVINTMLDATLPLTTSEYIEWGNPNEKPAFDYMIRYSPYDNVKAQPYPAMLVEVSYNDSQVPYWEGSKLVAKLRSLKTNDNPLLLKATMGAGHGGSSGRYDRLHEIAFEYAFMVNQVPGSRPLTP